MSDIIRLCQDWLLVKMDKEPDVTRGGIIIPDSAVSERVRTGFVRMVGPGQSLANGAVVPMEVSVGDRVAFFRENLEHKQGKQLTALVQELEEDLGLIRQKDILYILEEG